MSEIPRTISEAMANNTKEILSSQERNVKTIEAETTIIKNMIRGEGDTINSLINITKEIPSIADILNEFSTTTFANLEEISSITKDLYSAVDMNQGSLAEWKKELKSNILNLYEPIMLIPQVVQNTVNTIQISSTIVEQIPSMNNLLITLANWAET
jgi:hypothetical protein